MKKNKIYSWLLIILSVLLEKNKSQIRLSIWKIENILKLIERTFINVINTDTEIEDINNYIYHHEYILSCFRREWKNVEIMTKLTNVCQKLKKCVCMRGKNVKCCICMRETNKLCAWVCVCLYIYIWVLISCNISFDSISILNFNRHQKINLKFNDPIFF